MRGIALFTTLAMTVGTAAIASPVRVADRDRDGVRVEVRSNDPNGQWTRDRYDRYDGSHWSRDFRGRWMTLARSYTTQGQRQFIHVNGQRLSKLCVEGTRGEQALAEPVLERCRAFEFVAAGLDVMHERIYVCGACRQRVGAGRPRQLIEPIRRCA